MEELNTNRVYEKDALEFVAVAAEYCNMLETIEEQGRKHFITTMQQLLSLLYLKSLQVNSIDKILEDSVEKYVTEADWIKIKNKTSLKLGKFDSFVNISEQDAIVDDEETSVSLSECFADIYQDLSDFIYLYRNGNLEMMNDALWECRHNFQKYWGTRLLVIMDTFHKTLFETEDLDSDKWNSDSENEFDNKNPYIW